MRMITNSAPSIQLSIMEEFNVAHDSFCVLLDSLQQCEHAESSIKECLSMIDDMQRVMRREIGKRDQAALRVHKV